MNSKLIFLIGFMGAGKSHIARRLAEKFGSMFFDMDEYMEGKENMKIAEIFEQKGEEYFRNLERMCLRDFEVVGKAVVATGGGTPCFFDNMEWMNTHGVTIYLKGSAALLASRLKNETEHRPLIANLNEEELLDFISKKLQERSPFYEQANVIFDCEKEEEDVVELLFQNYLNLNIEGLKD